MPSTSINFAALKSAANIVSIIGQYVELKSEGSRYKGHCPFHDDRTPSFIVTPDMAEGGIFKCFSDACGVAGDVITFVEKIENISKAEAIKIVADLSGYELPAMEARVKNPSNQVEKPGVKGEVVPIRKPAAAAPAKEKRPQIEYGPKQFIESYPYVDRDGVFRYEVRRMHAYPLDKTNTEYEKYFYQWRKHPEDGLWVCGIKAGTYVKTKRNEWVQFRKDKKEHAGLPQCELPEVERLLWFLPDVLAHEEVLLFEGEKDSRNVRELGFTTTTASGGSSAPWLDSFTSDLTGRVVIHFPDQDDAGFKFAAKVEAALTGNADKYIRGTLPKGFKDVSEYLDSVSIDDQLARMATMQDLIALAKRDILEKEIERKGIVSPWEIIENFKGGIEAFVDPTKRPKGLSTGFDGYDELTGGLKGGELTILAARPAMGKTALALNIGCNVAGNIHDPKAVAIFSLEMSKDSLLTRMICSTARVDSHRYRKGIMGDHEQQEVSAAIEKLCSMPLRIGDKASVDLDYIGEKLEIYTRENEVPLGLVIVDYLQLCDATKEHRAKNRTAEVGSISRGFKLMSRLLNVPFLVLCQLSRAPETRPGDHRPMLSDLRESGNIEQDADNVAFIFREEVYRPDKESLKGIAELILAKQRNGPSGRVRLAFLNRYTRFENLAPGSEYYADAE